jgi:hypothetical protein
MSESNQNESSEFEFTRANVEKHKQIKLVDSDPETGLDLFSYIHCEAGDSNFLKQSRGVVFKGDDIVLKGFPYTYEYTEHDNLEEIRQRVNSETCSFYESYEGAVIRIFHYGGKWFLSTNRKLDAFKSKWAAKESFGSYFKKALQREFEENDRLREKVGEYDPESVIDIFCEKILDKEKQYMFLLLNNSENRIVCDPPENPTVFHVGTFIDGRLSMSEDVYLPYPKKLEFKSLEDLFQYVEGVNFKKLQGVIVFSQDNNQFKIFSRDYQYLYKARGNEPSIKFRYLQVRIDKDLNDALRYLYPDFVEHFENYENHIYDIAESINGSYIERFIRKNYVTVPKEEFDVIRKIHSWHIENRLENKININKVIDILNNEPPTNINRMIKRNIGEKEGKKESEITVTTRGGERKKRQYISLLTKKPVNEAKKEVKSKK